MELRGKARADLRNEQLKRLLKAWEQRRDELCDEISFKKGQLELLEEHIKFAYTAILDVNREEGDRERQRLTSRVQEIQKQEAEEKMAEKRTQREIQGEGPKPKTPRRKLPTRTKKKT